MDDFNLEMEKCEKLLGLFKDFLESLDDTCIFKDDKYGMILLQSLVDDHFEHNKIYREAPELFQSLLSMWEFEWTYDKGMKAKLEDLDDVEAILTDMQKKEREEMQEYYLYEGVKIISEDRV